MVQRQRKGRGMTAQELKSWMAEHGYTGARLSIVLGVTERTIFRWRSGGSAVPPFMDLALESLARRDAKSDARNRAIRERRRTIV